MSGTAPRLLVATGNPGKLREYRKLLQGAGVELAALAARTPEDADSYEANAALKAEAASAAGGLPALGDDSGLEVEALGGYPGLRSARIASTLCPYSQSIRSKLLGWPTSMALAMVCTEPRG